jgi:hypothetical protein
MLYSLDFVRELIKSIASSLKYLVDTSIEYRNPASAYIVDLL